MRQPKPTHEKRATPVVAKQTLYSHHRQYKWNPRFYLFHYCRRQKRYTQKGYTYPVMILLFRVYLATTSIAHFSHFVNIDSKKYSRNVVYFRKNFRRRLPDGVFCFENVSRDSVPQKTLTGGGPSSEKVPRPSSHSLTVLRKCGFRGVSTNSTFRCRCREAEPDRFQGMRQRPESRQAGGRAPAAEAR